MISLRERGLEDRIEVYVDGGFRRGTDIFKALALGAKGVGLGRPFLYAMSSYGQEGVEKLIDILQNELETAMRLMGCSKLSDIKREMVLTSSLPFHNGRAPLDSLFKQNYELLQSVIKSKL